VSHGRSHQTYEYFIDGIKESIITVATHFDAGKIFAEYDFHYFRYSKVPFVRLLTLVGDFPKEEGT